MAQVTAALVKQLREMTDSPMMECKKALVEADGDIEKAVDVLRTMGLAKAVKRAGRDTNEGTIGCYISEDGKVGALVELTCETDFVGTNGKFRGFANDLAKVVAENDPADLDAFKACPMGDNSTVEAELTEMIHVIGENMKINRFDRVVADNGTLSAYVHHDGKHADIVVFEVTDLVAAAEEFRNFAHDVAMQIVASNPIAATRDAIPDETIEHEKEIYRAQAAESGRPEKFWDGIINGRLKKFFQEFALVDQDFVKDPSMTITEYADKIAKNLGGEIKIVSFTRYNFGE